MENIRRCRLSLVLLLLTLGSFAAAIPVAAAENKERIMVGRITHVEGKLLRYIEEKKDWVVTVKDSPFGLEDALYSEEDAKAEFILPNGTWLRIGENTQVQLIDLNAEATTLDVGAGLVRLYNRSENAVVKATTPFGYVVAKGNTVFDLYVGDKSLEVIAIRGKVDFVHEKTDTRYEVSSGSFSIIADNNETARGKGTVDASWDDWNGNRDVVWNQRMSGRVYSSRYLPAPLHDEGYVLDETGRWERVYYQGKYRHMWRPLRVERGWRPFTVGRWVVYYGDQCWIPDEPFGYVTHHYGSWIYVESRRCWYWAPPVMQVVESTPRFSLGFGWYPGRVAWIHSGAYIGWVPLAPYETYYCYRPWGYRATIVDPTVSVSVNFNLANFLFINHAVVVNHDYFYSGVRYTPYIENNIGRSVIINNYQPVTVINNTVINNYSTDARRFAYTDMPVLRTPHGSVMDRITVNQRLHAELGSIGRDPILQDVTRVRALAEPSAIRESHQLTVAGKLVEPGRIHHPLDSLALTPKEMKGRERQAVDPVLRGHGFAGAKELRHHGGKSLKAHGRLEIGESRHGGRHSFDQPIRSHGKGHQELSLEQFFSGGKGHYKHERVAMDHGGRKEAREQSWAPRESGKGRGHGHQQQDFRQVEQRGPREQHQAGGQGHKGGGKHWQEGQVVAQEHHGKGRGKD